MTPKTQTIGPQTILYTPRTGRPGSTALQDVSHDIPGKANEGHDALASENDYTWCIDALTS